MTWLQTGGLRRPALFAFTACVALQSYLLLSYSEIPAENIQHPIQMFQEMCDGRSIKPFVARALVPFVVRTLAQQVPYDRAESFVAPLRWARFHFPKPLPPGDPWFVDLRYYGVWLYLAIASLTLLAEGIHRLIVREYEAPALLVELAAATGLLLWPLLIAYANYIYDVFTPTLIVWTLLMAIERRWALYLPLLLAAAFHKETMVTLPIALAYLYYRDPPWRHFLPSIAAQLAVVLAIRLYLSSVVFARNGGNVIDFHLFSHNLSLQMWLVFLPTACLIVLLVLTLVHPGFSAKPRAAKAVALTSLPLLFMGLLFGYFDEIRQYSEGYAGWVCLAFPTVAGLLGSDRVQRRTGVTPRHS